MRELKFRAWHSGANNSLGKRIFPPQMLYDKWNGEVFRFAEEGQPVEIMQYTGLKDKNSKEIYEGDILLADENYTDGGYELKLQIKWDSDKAGFYLYDINIDDSVEDDELYALDNCYEVIGNIYENPELMEVSNG